MGRHHPWPCPERGTPAWHSFWTRILRFYSPHVQGRMEDTMTWLLSCHSSNGWIFVGWLNLDGRGNLSCSLKLCCTPFEPISLSSSCWHSSFHHHARSNNSIISDHSWYPFRISLLWLHPQSSSSSASPTTSCQSLESRGSSPINPVSLVRSRREIRRVNYYSLVGLKTTSLSPTELWEPTSIK